MDRDYVQVPDSFATPGLEGEDSVNLKAFVRPFVDKAADDRDAFDKIVAHLSEDSEVFLALAWPLIRSAVWKTILEVRRSTNSRLLASPVEKIRAACGEKAARAYADGEERARKRLESYAQGLLDGYKLPDGTRLGDATRSVLEAARKEHAAFSRANAAKAKWLYAIERALPNDSVRVRDVLSEDRVRAMAKRAKAAVK